MENLFGGTVSTNSLMELIVHIFAGGLLVWAGAGAAAGAGCFRLLTELWAPNAFLVDAHAGWGQGVGRDTAPAPHLIAPPPTPRLTRP